MKILKFFSIWLAFLAGVVSFTQAQAPLDWCYSDPACQPSTWPGTCKSGSMQSPINLPYFLPKFAFGPFAQLFQNHEYQQPHNFIITNNGHTVQASLNAELTSTSALSGSLFHGNSYNFSQMHFHWGKPFGYGSEHSINNIRYPMECHLVHYKSKFPSLTAAVASNEADAVTVIAILFKESVITNPALVPLTNAFSKHKIQNVSTQTTGSGLVLSNFLFQSDMLSLFLPHPWIQYRGSLTTPGCSEVVLWNVMANPVEVSPDQLNEFITLLNAHGGGLLRSNFRSIQPTNGRPITDYTVFVKKQ